MYGFENGDRVLKCLTQILKRNIPLGEFIGHIGGDDFIAIMSQDMVVESCNKVISEFDKSILSFYNQDDIDKGLIVTKNRYGIEESYPLLTISIAGVNSNKYDSIYDLAESAGRIKKDCKEILNSNFIIT